VDKKSPHAAQGFMKIWLQTTLRDTANFNHAGPAGGQKRLALCALKGENSRPLKVRPKTTATP